MAAALLGGLILAPFLLRRRGIYFGLLSIAFGEMFYFIAYRYTDVTGGEDGMNIARPYAGLPSAHVAVSELGFYYTALALFVVALFAFRTIVRSPFGRTLIAIRQNEPRVRYLGLNTDRFIFVALLISVDDGGLERRAVRAAHQLRVPAGAGLAPVRLLRALDDPRAARAPCGARSSARSST